MTASEPLILVLTILAVLWFVGVLLNKLNSTPKIRRQAAIRGMEITPYLHVLGLKEYQCNELKAIVSHGDELALKKFLAYYHPRFEELDDYIAGLRKRFLENLGKPLANASDIEKIAAANRIITNDPPAPYDFTVLSNAELRLLLEFGATKGQSVNQDFLKHFGDVNFLENYYAFKQLSPSKNCTLYIPKNHPDRALLDLLAGHGVVLKGRKIELQDRLRILPLDQLNNMARELRIGKTFQSHDHAVENLAKTPGAAILLAMV